MATASELSILLQDVFQHTQSIVEQASACERLISMADAKRKERATKLTVQGARWAGDRILGRVQGSTSLYNVRITLGPKRSFSCTCPDSRNRGKKVGPCKHTLALAAHWKASVQPEVDRLEVKLTEALF